MINCKGFDIVNGSVKTGLYNENGKVNVVDATSSSTFVGLYHPCGAYNVTFVSPVETTYAANGSLNVDPLNPAAALVAAYSSDGQGLGMVFHGSTPSFFIKDLSTPANDLSITLNSFDAFNNILTYTSPSAKRVLQADGRYKYCAHNLFLNSASPATQNITTVVGVQYRVNIEGSGSIVLSGAGTGTATAGSAVTITATTTTLTCTVSGSPTTAHVHRAPADQRYLETSGSPRYALPITYTTDGVAERLVNEPQATNLRIYSQNFGFVPRSKFRIAITDNDVVAPDGTMTADTIIPNTADAFHGLGSSFTPVVGAYTHSVYAKPNGYDWVIFQNTMGGILAYASFNVATGEIGTLNSDVTSAEIVPVANGFYRCSMTITAPATTAGVARLVPSLADDTINFAGDAVSGVSFWGEQFEEGSAATSYIHTEASTVTRAADVISLSMSAFPFSFATGTAYSDAEVVKLTNSTFTYVFKGDINLDLLYDSSGLRARLGGSQLILENPAVSGRRKVAHAYSSAGKAASMNGATALTDSVSDLLTTSVDLYLGNREGNFVSNSKLREFLYVPEKLDNTALEEITTL